MGCERSDRSNNKSEYIQASFKVLYKCICYNLHLDWISLIPDTEAAFLSKESAAYTAVTVPSIADPSWPANIDKL